MSIIIKKIKFFIHFYFAFGILTTKADQKSFDAIFFENVSFKSKKLLIWSLFFFLLKSLNFFFLYIIGEYYLAPLEPEDCMNLPKEWQNRVSSVLVNTCIVVYTTSNCESSKETQIFNHLNPKYFDVNFSQPNNIPSFSFYNSW